MESRLRRPTALGPTFSENDHEEDVFNVMSLVDAELANDPHAAHRALSMLTCDEALEFYHQQCVASGVKPNNSFVRILQGEVSSINFANSYFGEHGMKAVAPTLQRIPIISLCLANTGLSFDDVGQLHAALASHPTLTAIDLTGNKLSLPSARRLHSLAIQNKRLTTIAVDDVTPKGVLIQRQCLSNANQCVYASSCVVCQRSMIHSPIDGVESHIILSIIERLGPRLENLSAAEYECIWRCLVACVDINDGVLFLCSPECVQALAEDMVVALYYLVSVCVPESASQSKPKSAILNRCVADFVARLQRERYSPELFSAYVAPEEPKECHWVTCSLTGEPGVAISRPQSTLMRMLAKDLGRLGPTGLRPSAFSRTLHLLLRTAQMQPCSSKSVRMLVRFCIHGSGCALLGRPHDDDSLLTSLATPLPLPPSDQEFAVTDLSAITILDQGEHDTACACAVASLIEDIDMVSMDPCFLFAAARHLSGKQPAHLGVDLRSACLAVKVIGCLPMHLAPFTKDTPRHVHADWNRWQALPNFDELERHAFSHRKLEYFVVSAPHGNTFDNFHAALYAYRHEQRCIVATMKWRVEWMSADLGIIPSEKLCGGFLTAIKIVGYTTINHVGHLVLQANFGRKVGNKGFFYATRAIVNRSIRGRAYMFLNRLGVMQRTGMPLPAPTYSRLVGSEVSLVVRSPTAVFNLLRMLFDPALRQTSAERLQDLQQIVKTIPVSLMAIFAAHHCFPSVQEQQFLQSITASYSLQSTSQIAFLWSEVLGADTLHWVQRCIGTLNVVYDARRAAADADTRQRRHLRERRGSLWISEADNAPGAGELANRERGAERPGGSQDEDEEGPPSVLQPRPPKSQQKASATAASGRGNAPRKSVAKQQEDAIIEKHRRVLDMVASSSKEEQAMIVSNIESAARAERERQEARSEIFRRKTAFTWDPRAIVSTESNLSESPMYTLQKRSQELPGKFIGRRWQALTMPDSGGCSSLRACMFVHDSFCYYDVAAMQPTTPLLPMKNHDDFKAFPFSNGFDAVSFCRAISTSEAYFFCEEHWLRWDFRRSACTDGPFSIHMHGLFRSIPEQFRCRIDAVIDVVGKPQLVFISGMSYLIFDLERRAVCSGLPCPFASGPLAPLFASFPGVPSSALYDFSVAPSSNVLHVFSSAGATVRFDMNSMAALDTIRENRTDLSSPSFRSLPLPFLQVTTTAFSALQAALIHKLPKNKVANPQQLVPPPLKAPSGQESGAEIEGLAGAPLKITTDFEVAAPRHAQLAPSAEELLRQIISPIDTHAPPDLLCNLAKLRHPRGRDELFFSLDAGEFNSYRFGYLQLFFDFSDVDIAEVESSPITLSIENSWDGACFRSVTESQAVSLVSDVWWPATHSARHWRVRFLGFPADASVVRICFFSVHWVTDSPNYALAEPFKPPPSSVVFVNAGVIHQAPRKLLDDIATEAIFETAPRSRAYVAKHCILPLLPPATSALFFVGDSFVEWDLTEECVVGSRLLTFTKHPGFKNLPFPFCNGLDAAFYPDPLQDQSVLLVAACSVLEWSLSQGSIITGPFPLLDSFWFAGLPAAAIRDGVDAIINIWERPGQVFIFSGVNVTRWNVHQRALVDGPLPRHRFPVVHSPLIDGALLAAASFPNKPHAAFLFSGERYVCVTWARDKKVVSRSDPIAFSLSSDFARIAWYLQWGATTTSTSLLIDFVKELPLLTGLTLRSQDGCRPETVWKIEASVDAVHWNSVAHHTQTMPKSSTMWAIDCLPAGRRYWRLTVERNDFAESVSYHHLQFHCLPCQELVVLPRHVQTSGEVSEGELFAGASVSFAHAARPLPGHITVDYGDDAPPEISAMSFTTESTGVSDLWAVLHSDDGAEWTEVGSWRVHGQYVKLHWAPNYPHRFWRVELRASLGAASPGLRYRDWCFHEYTGPSFVSSDRQQYLRGLAALFPSIKSPTRLNIDCVVGSCLTYDFKGEAQALCGVGIYSEVDSLTFMTSFVVEYSDDVVNWYNVGSVLVCDDLGTAAWENEGRHRFWRLRIAQHYGGSVLRFIRIEFFVCGPTLYRRHQRHVHQLADGAIFSDNDFVQGEFVACHAVLPPHSQFVVERGDSDSASWAPVGVLKNASAHDARVTCGWALVGSSLFWRLRDASQAPETVEARVPEDEDEDETSGEAQSPLVPANTKRPRNVTWSSFTGSRKHVAVLRNSASACLAKMDGFAAVVGASGGEDEPDCFALPLLLSEGCNDKPIVVSLPDASDPTLTWTFPHPTSFTSIDMVLLWPVVVPSDSFLVLIGLSDDGAQFSTVARIRGASPQLAGPHPLGASWGAQHSAKYWRLTFIQSSEATRVSIGSVRWCFRDGCPSLIPRADALPASNELHALWLQEYDAESASESKKHVANSYSHAQSFFNGFVEEGDLSSTGKLLVSYVRHQKSVQKIVTRNVKEQRGASRMPINSAPQFIDFCRLLDAFSDPQATELRSMLGFVTINELKFLKDTSSWWMPKAEYRGLLVQPLLGFVGSPVSFSVRWQLSPSAVRDMSSIAAALPLDRRHSAMLFTMNITNEQWVASVNFPSLAPLLYETGIAGANATICFATNHVEFGEGAPLLRPGGDPHSTILPIHIYRGTSIVAEFCPATCLGSHRLGAIVHFVGRKKFKRMVCTAVVHTAGFSEPSLSTYFRFTVATDGLCFGIDGLSVKALLFEARWDGTMRPLSFVSLSAAYSVGGCSWPIAVKGHVHSDRPTVSVRCRCPQGVMDAPGGLNGARMEDFSITAECVMTEAGFTPLSAQISGTLRLHGLTFQSQMELGASPSSTHGLNVQLMDSTFAELSTLCSAITGVELANDHWMASRHLMSVTCALGVNTLAGTAAGAGAASFNSQSGTASIAATASGLHISCELPAAQIGVINVESRPDTGLTVDATAPPVSAGIIPTIRIDGMAALVTSTPTPCQIELSSLGTICLTSGVFFEAVMRHPTLHPINGRAVITVPAVLFEEPIRRELLRSHIISGITAAAVPFAFMLRSVFVEQCTIERRTMFISFRGVLMGTACDVAVSSCCPSNTTDVIDNIAVSVAARMIEQCHETLWTMFERFAGTSAGRRESASTLVGDSIHHIQSELQGGGLLASRNASSHAGTFVGAWQEVERAQMEMLLENAVETV